MLMALQKVRSTESQHIFFARHTICMTSLEKNTAPCISKFLLNHPITFCDLIIVECWLNFFKIYTHKFIYKFTVTYPAIPCTNDLVRVIALGCLITSTSPPASSIMVAVTASISTPLFSWSPIKLSVGSLTSLV